MIKTTLDKVSIIADHMIENGFRDLVEIMEAINEKTGEFEDVKALDGEVYYQAVEEVAEDIVEQADMLGMIDIENDYSVLNHGGQA